jgi:putative NADH-flavin reductase
MQAQNKIKALLIGASGSAGKQIVSAATRKDFIVTCLLRNPGALGINSPWVRLEQGDVFNIEDLRRVMPEQEVVISTFGSKKFDEPVDDRTRAVTNLVTVMKEFGVKRIITLAGAGIANVKPDQLLSETPFYPANL